MLEKERQKKAAMATRYESFNEMTFEAYVRSAIKKSVLKKRIKKTAQDSWDKPSLTYCQRTGIILLYFFRQVKTDEIARRLKTSSNTVRQRRRAALRKLRDYLENVP